MDIDFEKLSKDQMEALEKTLDLFEDSKRSTNDPVWFRKKRIDEVAFCESFLKTHPMKCIGGFLYDVDGRIDEAKIENEIFNMVKNYSNSSVARMVTKLLDALKIAAFSPELPIEESKIFFKNGTYFLEKQSFIEKKEFCLNRLPVLYNAEAPEPTHWKSFLKDLLYEEDIPALQEFMGYAFIPCNRAQAMLMIIGHGGEGKSRVALVLRALLGDNMNMCSIQKLATDRFARADQEGKLLMVDDDMKTDGLPDTGILKTLVTLEDKYDLERKGKQSVQGRLYVRIMALGNGTLTALYDKSDGFYRRQLVIHVKPKKKDRIDDRNLIDKLINESEGIAQWCLEGLHRLIENNYEFTVSDRMKQNLEEMKKTDNNIYDFLESDGYIQYESHTSASSKDLYFAYCRWCGDNLEKPLSEKTFSSQLKRDQDRLGIRYCKNLDIGGGKKARGYTGINVRINVALAANY